MTDQEQIWVEQARQGDRRAFGQLVRAYERPVYNLTYRMLGNAQEAEDAAQEAFLRAYSNLDRYDPKRKFSTWLFSIANHHCIDRLRKRRAIHLSIEDDPVAYTLRGNAVAPEKHVLDVEQSIEVQQLLNRLSPDYRTPLILRYWEGLSYEEIAQTMDLTVSAVKSRLFRARQQMAQLYQDRAAATDPPGRGATKPGQSSQGSERARSGPVAQMRAAAQGV